MDNAGLLVEGIRCLTVRTVIGVPDREGVNWALEGPSWMRDVLVACIGAARRDPKTLF
jgi:hypothetical protein